MTDLDARADRVRAVVDTNHSEVIGCTGDVVTVEIPANVSIGLNVIWGMGVFCPVVQAPRGMNGNIVVYPDMVTKAYYIIEINLAPWPIGALRQIRTGEL